MITLPISLVLSRFSQFVRPGQDAMMKRLVEIIIVNLEKNLEMSITPRNLFMVMKVACTAFGRSFKVAEQFLPLLADSLSTVDHPNSGEFVLQLRNVKLLPERRQYARSS